MKSRLINAQNQRVERISPSTLVVGIDIVKENHAAQATSFRGVVLTNRAIWCSNSLSGFEHLERSIRKLQKAHGVDKFLLTCIVQAISKLLQFFQIHR